MTIDTTAASTASPDSATSAPVLGARANAAETAPRLPALPRSLPPIVPPSSEGASWRRRAWTRFASTLNRTLDRIPGCATLYGHTLRRSLAVPTVPLGLAGDHGLQGLRIAVLSDIHAGSFTRRADLEFMARRLTEAEPDLICIPGDLINSRPREVDALPPLLASIAAPLGVFAVPGNHDHTWGPGLDGWTQRVEAMGVRVLTNRGQRVSFRGSTFWLAGVDDYAEGDVDLDAALAGRNPAEPCILMAHQPDYFAESLRADVDLTLAGHTHGGQIRFGSWIPMAHTRLGLVDGLHSVAERHLFVSRGVGATLLPLRIGTRPEIPVIQIR